MGRRRRDGAKASVASVKASEAAAAAELEASLDAMASSGQEGQWLEQLQTTAGNDGQLHSMFLVDGFQLSGSGLGRHW